MEKENGIFAICLIKIVIYDKKGKEGLRLLLNFVLSDPDLFVRIQIVVGRE